MTAGFAFTMHELRVGFAYAAVACPSYRMAYGGKVARCVPSPPWGPSLIRGELSVFSAPKLAVLKVLKTDGGAGVRKIFAAVNPADRQPKLPYSRYGRTRVSERLMLQWCH
jgi:hypothetical protein